MKRIIISVTNDLATDRRVIRVANSLVKEGFEVTLTGRIHSKSLPLKSFPFKTKRFSLPFEKGFLFYATFNIRLFIYLLFSKADILLSNDLDTLPANYLASIIKRSRLVYDSHEYFTEVPELIDRPFVRKVWLSIEKLILPRIKISYTVCDSIAYAYKQKYKIEMHVIRNVPYLEDKSAQVEKISLPYFEGKKTLIYQGHINKGRGLEKIIKAMHYLDSAVLLIVGDGDIKNDLEKMVEDEGLNHKVHFTGRVSADALSHYTKKADIGIALEEDSGLNYYYSLSNKLFDYIHAEIPVIVSAFPEMKKITGKYDTGICIDEKDPARLAEQFRKILNNEPLLARLKANAGKAKHELCWEKESAKLINIFNNI